MWEKEPESFGTFYEEDKPSLLDKLCEVFVCHVLLQMIVLDDHFVFSDLQRTPMVDHMLGNTLDQIFVLWLITGAINELVEGVHVHNYLVGAEQ